MDQECCDPVGLTKIKDKSELIYFKNVAQSTHTFVSSDHVRSFGKTGRDMGGPQSDSQNDVVANRLRQHFD